MMMYGTSSAAWSTKMTVPMCPHSQRSRNICTGVMNPWRFPSAQRRVPMKNSVSGMTNADDEAISPNVTTPFANAWPADPRIVKAVMFVPKSDSRKTSGPSERPARKYSSATAAPRPDRDAKIPM
jgi:hypothetical protein